MLEKKEADLIEISVLLVGASKERVVFWEHCNAWETQPKGETLRIRRPSILFENLNLTIWEFETLKKFLQFNQLVKKFPIVVFCNPNLEERALFENPNHITIDFNPNSHNALEFFSKIKTRIIENHVDINEVKEKMLLVRLGQQDKGSVFFSLPEELTSQINALQFMLAREPIFFKKSPTNRIKTELSKDKEKEQCRCVLI